MWPFATLPSCRRVGGDAEGEGALFGVAEFHFGRCGQGRVDFDRE